MSGSFSGTRLATHDDHVAVLDIDAVAAAGDSARSHHLQEAIEAGACMVYEREGRVLGFSIMKRGHFYGRDFIDLLVVASDARRQGIGRALMRATVGAATTPRVFTSTSRSNGPMQALLQSEGWSRSGVLEGLDEGDPELVYYWSR